MMKSVGPQIAPAMKSEAPLMNLVRLCTTMSAPCLIGETISGLKVLSTTSFAPWAWAMLGQPRDVGDAQRRVGDDLDVEHLGLAA